MYDAMLLSDFLNRLDQESTGDSKWTHWIHLNEIKGVCLDDLVIRIGVYNKGEERRWDVSPVWWSGGYQNHIPAAAYLALIIVGILSAFWIRWLTAAWE